MDTEDKDKPPPYKVEGDLGAAEEEKSTGAGSVGQREQEVKKPLKITCFDSGNAVVLSKDGTGPKGKREIEAEVRPKRG